MKILVIGCGSIGRRHTRLLKEMGVEVAGVDPAALKMDTPELSGITVYHDTETALNYGQWDGAIIATPNHMHIPPALECIAHEIPLLIEKPLAHTVAEAQKLLWANAGGLKTLTIPNVAVLMGYMMRHHPGLQRLKRILDEGTLGQVLHASIWCASYLPNWRPGSDHKQGYAARVETGGGVLLDCSHEIDYCLWLFGEPESVSCTTANTGTLAIDAEELADLIIRFRSGVQVNVHLSYLDHWGIRGCRVVGAESTASWDFGTDFVWLRPLAAQANPVAPDDLYKAELRHFLNVIKGREVPVCTASDGLATLRLIEAAKESAETGSAVRL